MSEGVTVDSLLREVAAAPPLPIAPALVEPGVVIDETFEIRERLGTGGMGVVYAARDRELDREVALKLMRFETAAAGPLLAEVFEREARATARLNHPNVVTLYRTGRWRDAIYLVLERLHGETLATRLARGPLPVNVMTGIVAQIVAALAHMHAAHVLHRDLKPQNIFLVDGSHVKVLDFGVSGLRPTAARVEEPEPMSMMRYAGTPGYMAPEQWARGTIDQRTDIWALGVVMFECVTGRLPFGTSSLAERELDLDDVARALRGIDRALAAAIVQCLSPRADARPSTTALAAVLRPRRSRRLAVGLAAAGAVLAIAGAKLAATPSACAVGDRTERIWNAQVKARLATRLRITEDLKLRGVYDDLVRHLDGYVADWAALWTASCDVPATRACLDERYAMFARVVSIVERVPPALAADAEARIATLPPLHDCRDPASARLASAMPTRSWIRHPDATMRSVLTFGGLHQDNVHDLHELPGGDIVVAAFTDATGTLARTRLVDRPDFSRTGALVRIRPDGTLAWSLATDDRVMSVEPLPGGDLAIGGVTSQRHGFVGVVDGARGTLRWRAERGSFVHALATDAAGTLYAGGYVEAGTRSAPFVASWSRTGTQRWSTEGAGTAMARTHGLALDGDTLVVGATIFGAGTFAARPIEDGCIVARLDPASGDLRWLVATPSTERRRCSTRGLALHGGQIVVGGDADGTAWISALSVADGATAWRRTFGTGETAVRAIDFLPDGTIIAGGWQYETDIAIDAVRLPFRAVTDAFVLAFDASGNALRGYNFGGASADRIRSLDVGPTGRIWIGGRFQRMTVGGTELASSPWADAFVLELDPALRAD